MMQHPHLYPHYYCQWFYQMIAKFGASKVQEEEPCKLATLVPNLSMCQHSIMVKGVLSFDEPWYKISIFAILSSSFVPNLIRSHTLANALENFDTTCYTIDYFDSKERCGHTTAPTLLDFSKYPASEFQKWLKFWLVPFVEFCMTFNHTLHSLTNSSLLKLLLQICWGSMGASVEAMDSKQSPSLLSTTTILHKNELNIKRLVNINIDYEATRCKTKATTLDNGT